MDRREVMRVHISAEKPGAAVWSEFFEFVRGIDVPKGWMEERPMNRICTEDSSPFDENY